MTRLCFLPRSFRNIPTLIPSISCQSVNISSDVSTNNTNCLPGFHSAAVLFLLVSAGIIMRTTGKLRGRTFWLTWHSWLICGGQSSGVPPVQFILHSFPPKTPGRMLQFAGRNFNEKSCGFLSIIYTKRTNLDKFE